MAATISRRELEAAHCWESTDAVPGRPAMTEFRRQLRLHQARWREAQGHPIGTQPIAPRPGQAAHPVGSRIPLGYGRETGANLVSPAALNVARARLSAVEAHQSLDHQRIWADLLSSPALAFSLFGDLAQDPARADRAVRTWWPDTPGRLSEVRFAHSPGRLDPTYLGSLRAFDAAFMLDLGGGSRGIIGVDVEYHERAKPETPKPSNLHRYLEVAERSGIFRPGATDALAKRSGLAVMWLEHLLLLSMLQHPTDGWRWGRYVVVHPRGNLDYAEACARYRSLLSDTATFGSMTLEELLDAAVFPPATAATLTERFLVP